MFDFFVYLTIFFIGTGVVCNLIILYLFFSDILPLLIKKHISKDVQHKNKKKKLEE